MTEDIVTHNLTYYCYIINVHGMYEVMPLVLVLYFVLFYQKDFSNEHFPLQYSWKCFYIDIKNVHSQKQQTKF